MPGIRENEGILHGNTHSALNAAPNFLNGHYNLALPYHSRSARFQLNHHPSNIIRNPYLQAYLISATCTPSPYHNYTLLKLFHL